MKEKIGIIGLGRCGLPAAARYVQGGYEVFGYARRPEVIKKFTAQGGVSLANPPNAPSQPYFCILFFQDRNAPAT